MLVKATSEKKKIKKKKKHLLSGATRPNGILITQTVYLKLKLGFVNSSIQFLQKAETPIFGHLRSFWENSVFGVACEPKT